jgi:hypothetical protein
MRTEIPFAESFGLTGKFYIGLTIDRSRENSVPETMRIAKSVIFTNPVFRWVIQSGVNLYFLVSNRIAADTFLILHEKKVRHYVSCSFHILLNRDRNPVHP